MARKIKRNGRVAVVAAGEGLSLSAMRDDYRASVAASKLDSRLFNSVIKWGITMGEWRSLGYPIDLPVERGDFSPLAFVVAARTLSAFTRGEKRAIPMIGEAYDPPAARRGARRKRA